MCEPSTSSLRGVVVIDRFSLEQLDTRIIAAPMAGGPATPGLAAAVTNGGGLGFLAGGMLSAAAMADSLIAARKLTSGALGVNVFVLQPAPATTEQVDAYAAALSEEAERYGVRLGEPHRDDVDDDWAAKLDALCDLRPEVVSFTFGAPNEEACRRLRSVGILTAATVTTVAEAEIALACGVDALVAQGPSAGGHRATFDPLAPPSKQSLDNLLAALIARVDCPVVAAGGLATSDDVSRMLSAGASAVQLGTAFLLADEAGTNPVHRAALVDPQFTETVITRAFTGRYARALRNQFIEKHEDQAIFGFPDAGRVSAPVLTAAGRAGDPHGTSLFAGTEFRKAMTGRAVEIVRALAH